MRCRIFFNNLIGGMMCLAFGTVCNATTIQTTGAGSAVTSVDRSATFDSMTSSATVNLDIYSENKLSITTASTSWGHDPTLATLDPFHGLDGPPPPLAFYAMANGSEEWVTIKTTDSKLIFGTEFMYGNTWTTGDIYGVPWGNQNALLQWETFKGGTMVSSGDVSFLAMGTIVGFSDSVGFDELLVRSIVNGDTSLQAIALDNLNVQLSAPNAVPLPAALPLFATGVGALGLLGWRRKRKNAAAIAAA